MNFYLNLFSASAIDRIALIRAGVKHPEVRKLVRILGLSESLVMADLGICPATRTGRYPSGASEKLLGLMSLVGQVQSMIPGSTSAIKFDAGKWLGAWLDSPLPALSGARPASYLDTMVGQCLLQSLIETIQSGAYA
jgi:hypothetical protein